MAQYTISHSEENKGWTSFWSYMPDGFLRLAKRFFTVKSGQLYIHNDEENTVMNNFYGTQYGTSIKTVINDAVADDKSFKTLVLESDQKWDAIIRTNYTNSSIEADKFNTRESRQFAFIRQNENEDDFNGGATQGIGVIISAAGNTITFSRAPEFVNVGDVLKQIDGDDIQTIGTITGVSGSVITVNTIVTTPVPGLFSFSQKNARAEGSDVRGYYMEVMLINNGPAQCELFSVNTEASKSYV